MSTASTRQQKRAPVTLKIKFKSSTLQQFVERYSVDISQGGIFIRTKSPLEVGTPLRFEFQLKDATPLITGEGTVVWTREHDPARRGLAPGMGVRFDRLPGESQQVLNQILEAKRTQPDPDDDEDDLDDEFTDSPTRVAPADFLQGLADGSRGGLLDNAFEEATKVGDLDDLVARTAEPEEEEADDEPVLTSASRNAAVDDAWGDATEADPEPEPESDDGEMGLAPSRPASQDGEEMGLAPSRPASQDGEEMGLAPSRSFSNADEDFDREPPPTFGDDEVLTPRPKGDFPEHVPTELNVAPPPPKRDVSDEAPTALALKQPTPEEVESARSGATRRPESSGAHRASPAAAATELVDRERSEGGSNLIWFALAAVILAAAGVGGWWLMSQRNQESAATQQQRGIQASQVDPGTVDPAAVAADAAVDPGIEVTIESETPGAVAELIGGDQDGPVPIVFRGLEEGETYKVRLSAPGHIPAEIEITGGEAPEAVKLEPKPRVLAVKSSPSGAAVYVNNRREGRTPLEVEIDGRLADADEYEVLIRRPGYDTVKEVVARTEGWNEEDERMVAALDVELERRRRPPPPPRNTGASSGGSAAKKSGEGEGSDGAEEPAGGDEAKEPAKKDPAKDPAKKEPAKKEPAAKDPAKKEPAKKEGEATKKPAGESAPTPPADPTAER